MVKNRITINFRVPIQEKSGKTYLYQIEQILRAIALKYMHKKYPDSRVAKTNKLPSFSQVYEDRMYLQLSMLVFSKETDNKTFIINI